MSRSGRYDLIGALARGEPDPGADAIRSVTDARWGYTELNHRHWLYTVAEAAGAEPPMPATAIARSRRELARPVDLDTAEEAKAEAVAEREERAAARVEAVNEQRHGWAVSVQWIESVEAVAGPAKTAKDSDHRRAWLGAARRSCVENVPVERRGVAGRCLTKHLRRAGWGDVSDRAAAAVVKAA